MTPDSQQFETTQSILHVCRREMLRPIRDEVLRAAGYQVESTCSDAEAVEMFESQPFALVLVDVEGQDGVAHAEKLCADVRTIHHGQLVAFLCNWQVAIVSDCPDEVLRTAFDPAAFVAGVKRLLESATTPDTPDRP